jgi:hypothetical protein
MNEPGFEPLVYRPALPLRWRERALKAVGWTVKPRYGPPVPFVYDRQASGIVVYHYPPKVRYWPTPDVKLHNRRKYDACAEGDR